MSGGGKYVRLTEPLHDYLVAHGSTPDQVMADLIAETAALGDVARMQMAPEQVAFLNWLTRLLGARQAVEVGAFTGMSGIAIARGLAPGGRLLSCDVNEEWTAVARRYWQRAGVADRIDLRLRPGAETLRALPDDEAFDLAVIDADKVGYATYYEEIVRRLRPGGVVCVDNVLRGGRVVEPEVTDDDTVAIRAFNDMLAADDRVEAVMLPIGDGFTLARKKPRA